MKLKCQPEDFEVEELSRFPLGRGPFSVYLLTKQNLGTLEAITAIQQRWQLSRRQISFGGLKDRHAVTRQFVTIHHGPNHDLNQTNFSLVFQGYAAQPFTAHDIQGNAFRIVMRDLRPDEVTGLELRAKQLLEDGIPNYYDDQRFGSLGESGEFIAAPWCRGDYERTLWLALAEPNTHDRPDARAIKETLRAHWGDWVACKAALPRSSTRSVITYLVDHPTDFRRAVALINVDLRSLYLAAFQSAAWNACLNAWMTEHLSASEWVSTPLATTSAKFPVGLDQPSREQFSATELPLPSARLHLEPGPLLSLYDAVLAQYQLTLREIRVKYPRDSFFSKGSRAVRVGPQRWQMQVGPDALYPGRSAATLRFELPRGSYATLVVKRLTLDATAAATLAGDDPVE